MISLGKKAILVKNTWSFTGFSFSKVNGYLLAITQETTTGSTELELTCLVCNMHSLTQLLKHQYFEVLVDHKAIENL